MKAGSAFTGLGGLDLGFERAGVESAWHIETDRHAVKVLKARWPEVPNYGDITKTDPGALPAVNVLHGGFPCQDISVAGKRAGLAGERSGLFHEFCRLIAALSPKWILIENVPGLLSSRSTREDGAPDEGDTASDDGVGTFIESPDFPLVITTLVELGYGVAWRTLDAQHFGVPQRRRRVFIVGCFGDGRAAAQVLFESESGGGDLAEGGEEGEGVAHALTGRSSGARLETEGNYVVGALTSEGGDGVGKRWKGMASNQGVVSGHIITHPLTSEGHDASEDGTGRGTPLVATTLTGGDDAPSKHGKRSGDDRMTMVVNARQTPIHGDKPGPLDRQGGSHAIYRKKTRAHTEESADESWEESERAELVTGDHRPTTLAAAAGIVRRLTPLECERLQGFPDGWTCLCPAAGDTMTCICPDSPRYRTLGNAVAVPVAQWVAERIVAVDRTLA